MDVVAAHAGGICVTITNAPHPPSFVITWGNAFAAFPKDGFVLLLNTKGWLIQAGHSTEYAKCTEKSLTSYQTPREVEA